MSKSVVSEMAQALREPARPAAYLSVRDAFTRDVARSTLRAEGYHVVAFASIDELADLGTVMRPDLVVIDEESVVSVATDAAPTIVLMSMRSPLTHDEARSLPESPGAAPTLYVAAPFSPLELTRAARRVRRLARPRAEATLHAVLARPRAQA